MADAPSTFIEKPAGPATEHSAGITAQRGSPKPEIKVSDMKPPEKAAAPAKAGTAKSRIFAELRKRANVPEDAPVEKPTYAKAKPKPEPAAEKKAEPAPSEFADAEEVEGAKPKGAVEPVIEREEEAAEHEATEPEEAEAAAAKEGEEAAASEEKPKKVSPWKLVDEHKKRVKDLERQNLELQSRDVPPEKIKPYEEKIAALEKQNKEMLEEIRYTNYKQHPEFKEKFEQPYVKAWERVLGELSGLTVATEDGERPMDGKDLMLIADMNNPKEAVATAKQMFGDDMGLIVVNHCNELRRLYRAQADALENAKKDGGERLKQMQEAQQKAYTEVTEAVRTEWSTYNEKVSADPKYGKFFTPVEGDEQGNQRLAKGLELADRAFSESPMAPGLTPEQRKAIIQRHAAVRLRAAAFGRLVYQNGQKDARIAELESKLKEFNGAEPARAGGTKPAPSAPKQGSAKSRVFAALQKYAK